MKLLHFFFFFLLLTAGRKRKLDDKEVARQSRYFKSFFQPTQSIGRQNQSQSQNVLENQLADHLRVLIASQEANEPEDQETVLQGLMEQLAPNEFNLHSTRF